MKYGLVLYKDTDNLGDDIQSYAASKFLPQVDYIIDREKLDEFVPEKKEYVTAIMNGWYLHNKYHFPFSPYINPKLVSMHFSENDLITEPGYEFLDGYTKGFLSRYGSLGCRDLTTKEVLDKLGYDTYFSGCMTLTIDKISKTKRGKYICVVDMNKNIVEHLKKVFPNYEIKEMSHWLIPSEQNKLTLNERMSRVEDYLKIYQNAQLVITDRLHVALPCLALETSTLLVYYDYNADRLSTFKDFVTHCSETDFFSYEKKDFEKIQNPDFYVEIRRNLKEEVKSFIKKSKNSNLNLNVLPELEDYTSTIKRLKHVEGLFLNKVESAKRELNLLKEEIKKLNTEYYILEKKYNESKITSDYFNEMKCSKSFIFYNKYYEARKKEKKKVAK